MGLIVQKYGGTSVGDLVRIQEVAKRVAKTYDAGNQVVVVLSAMSGVTDHLIQMAEVLSDKPNKREMDVLLATGEQTTVALLAIALEKMGYKAQSFLGHQVRILTNNAAQSARILDVQADPIKDALADNAIVVVAGFQGVDGCGNITTLGRGGSDTSAVAVAAALGADSCEIYTDVDGVYTADPRVVSKARKLKCVTHDVMLEMSSLGAKVLQIRSVEFAAKHNVPVHVRSSFNEEEGTMIVCEDRDMERMLVAGVTFVKTDARITVTKVPDEPGVAAKVFSAVADAGISVDMIIQNTRASNMTDITFTVPKTDYKDALVIVEKIAKEIGAESVAGDANIAKVSVTGVGMKSHHGVAAKMFSTLAAKSINIMMISTSEIRISCVVEEKYAELACQILHTEFGLDAD
ncbi:aspartate kinase [Desulfatibacillum aliphaticivorans]|uniref:aspartate kinase n=1 Tax=Desulfatibacillum aliphaticivorans TaxID=218208 RepID=UPI000421F873|nr:aspartate kinase [Desulfatibacillum aliphaticivorans]